VNILALLRQENASLISDMCEAGHQVFCIRDAAVHFRKLLNLPIQPVDFDENHAVMDMPAGFEFGETMPMIIDGIKDCIRDNKIDAMVTWTDAPPDQRVSILTARHMGVPTFEITHGATNTYRQGHFEYESYVDYVLAPGQHEADFRKFYGSNANVVVTGKPSFDWITQSENLKFSRNEARAQFGIDERRPVIVHAMTWRHPFSVWERDRDWGDKAVIEAHMNLLPICNTFLIIKPHYSQGNKEYANHIRNYCETAGVTDFAVMTGGPIVPLTMADLVVTHKSSIIVEAFLLDLPVVMFEFRERNDFSWFDGYGAELVADRGELYPAMARCLLDRETKERLAVERARGREYFNYKCDGDAGKRCVEVIEKAVAERQAA